LFGDAALARYATLHGIDVRAAHEPRALVDHDKTWRQTMRNAVRRGHRTPLAILDWM